MVSSGNGYYLSDKHAYPINEETEESVAASTSTGFPMAAARTIELTTVVSFMMTGIRTITCRVGCTSYIILARLPHMCVLYAVGSVPSTTATRN